MPLTVRPRAGAAWSDGQQVDDTGRPDVQARDSLFRRFLVVSYMLAATLGLLVAINIPPRDDLRPAALLALPTIVAISKIIGLYDRDELLLHKATLDEAPGVFQLATLFAVFTWLLESTLVAGAFDKVGFVALWATTFACAMVGRATARSLAERRPARTSRMSTAICS